MPDGTLAVSLPREIADSFKTKVPFEYDRQFGDWKREGDSLKASAEQTTAYGLLNTSKIEGALLFTCTIVPGESNSPFGVLLNPSEDLNPSFGLLFEPTRQTVSITQWPQSLDPFWASLTKAKVPVYEIDGPRMVERPIAINTGTVIKVQVLIEGSMVEAFVDDRLALTYRAYESGKSAATFGLYCEDGSVSFNNVAIATEG
jgi:beta-fructofuranosidase